MRLCLVFVLCLGCAFTANAVASSNRDGGDDDDPGALQILGWVERAYLLAPGFELSAKLDTGATTSSLNARIIKRFRQWGRRWIRFAVTNPETGEEIVMVRERQRTISIVQHEDHNDVRPTVVVEICIAGIHQPIEVSLVDRSNFIYPLLLGRRALSRFAVVDSSAAFLAGDPCPEGLPEGALLLDPSASNPNNRRSLLRRLESDEESLDFDHDEDIVVEDDDREGQGR